MAPVTPTEKRLGPQSAADVMRETYGSASPREVAWVTFERGTVRKSSVMNRSSM